MFSIKITTSVIYYRTREDYPSYVNVILKFIQIKHNDHVYLPHYKCMGRWCQIECQVYFDRGVLVRILLVDFLFTTNRKKNLYNLKRNSFTFVNHLFKFSSNVFLTFLQLVKNSLNYFCIVGCKRVGYVTISTVS